MSDTTVPLLPTRYEFWMTRVLVILGTVFWGAFLLGQLGRVQITPNIAVYLHDLIGIIFIATWIARERSLLFSYWLPQLDSIFRSNYLAFTFVGWVLVTTTIQSLLASDLVPVLYLLRIGLSVLTITCMTLVAYEAAWLRQRFQILPVVVGLSMAWFGVLQYLLLPDTRFLAAFGWDDHYYRMIGTLFDPNYLGLLLILTAVASANLLKQKRHGLSIAFACSSLLLVLPTFSRGSYLTAALGIALLAVHLLLRTQFSRKWILYGVAGLIMCCSVVIFFLPKPTGEGVKLLRTSTITARITAAQQQLAQVKGEEWLIGTGLYARDPAAPQISHARLPDNIVIMLITQTGIIGTVLGSVLLGKLLRSLYLYDSVSLLAVVLTLFHSLGTASLLQPFILLFLLVILGTRVLIQRSEWFAQSQ